MVREVMALRILREIAGNRSRARHSSLGWLTKEEETNRCVNCITLSPLPASAPHSLHNALARLQLVPLQTDLYLKALDPADLQLLPMTSGVARISVRGRP